MNNPRGLFVTGTDTEVGKTLVACGLIHAYRRIGLRVAGMKPVAAGCFETSEGWKNEDVEALLAAANIDAPLDALRKLIRTYSESCIFSLQET